MRKITAEELKDILARHKKWLYNKEGGEQADLGAYLQGIDLQGADLQSAILREANLRGADFQCADLLCANLRGADLRNADLRNADLRGADLRNADLRNADLRNADLRGAYRPWLVYAGNIGSRRYETLYFADYDNIRCGCWNNYKGGTLDEFKLRIDEVYPADSKNEEYQRYRLEYLSAIKMFESMREAYLKSLGERQ